MGDEDDDDDDEDENDDEEKDVEEEDDEEEDEENEDEDDEAKSSVRMRLFGCSFASSTFAPIKASSFIFRVARS
jgi:hypothetical protein